MRLALRTEGDCKVAYYAQRDTMDQAIRLGSIHIGVVHQRPQRWFEWLKLMQGIAEDLSAEATGARPGWRPARPA